MSSIFEADGRRFEIADDPEGDLLYGPMLTVADRLAGGEIDRAAAEREGLALIRQQSSGPAAERLASLE